MARLYATPLAADVTTSVRQSHYLSGLPDSAFSFATDSISPPDNGST